MISISPEKAVLFSLAACLLSWLLTGRVRRYALKRNLLDLPNQRSSHTKPTPRAGGIGFVAVIITGVFLLGQYGVLNSRQLTALLGGSFLVALAGLLDDRYGLSPVIRFTVHLLSVAWTIVWLGGAPPLAAFGVVLEWGWLGHVIMLLVLVWLINLFNFMDGIDGLTGTMTVFASLAGAALAIAENDTAGALLAMLIAAAVSGFQVWNWPPAMIFMGDTGSCFLGYMLGFCLLRSMLRTPENVWIWLILLSVFLADATVTLFTRFFRRQRWWEAHCSHTYQRLARRWRSHLPVTVLTLVIDLIWSLPFAVLAYIYPEWAVLLTALAIFPLVTGCIILKAGRDD